MAYHLMWKPSYNLDVKDVPPPTLEARVNVREANELYKASMEYKGKGLGDEYVLNMRRAELLLREILDKYPNSDKIGDVAYQLGDIYEGRAYKQYDRAAKYFERSWQWTKGAPTPSSARGAVRPPTERSHEGHRTVPRRGRTRHQPRPHQAGREAHRRTDRPEIMKDGRTAEFTARTPRFVRLRDHFTLRLVARSRAR